MLATITSKAPSLAAHVLGRDERRIDAVARGVGAARRERVGIDVGADDTTGAEAARGDRQDPRSATVVEDALSRRAARAASQRRHRRVVGCDPVPNASPGSSARLIAAGSTGSHHDGTIHNPSAIWSGANCACVARTQSVSGTSNVSCGGSALPRARPAPASAAARLSPVAKERRQPADRPARRRRHAGLVVERRLRPRVSACASATSTDSAPAFEELVRPRLGGCRRRRRSVERGM